MAVPVKPFPPPRQSGCPEVQLVVDPVRQIELLRQVDVQLLAILERPTPPPGRWSPEHLGRSDQQPWWRERGRAKAVQKHNG